MSNYLTPEFILRLERLRESLLTALKRFEFYRVKPAGPQITPEPDSQRPYGPGDDLRYIDWNLFARQDRFYIKTVVTEDEGSVHVVIDTSSSMRFPYEGKQERALETAAGISYLSLLSGNQVILHSCADRVLLTRKFDKGVSDARPLLEQISRMPVGNETNLGRCLASISKLNSNGSPSKIIIISDFIDNNAYGEKLDLLTNRDALITGIQILHRKEISPLARGNLLIKDPETGTENRLVMGYRAQKEMRKSVSRFLQKTKAGFVGRNMQFFRYSEDKPFEEHVMDFFTSNGRSTGS